MTLYILFHLQPPGHVLRILAFRAKTLHGRVQHLWASRHSTPLKTRKFATRTRFSSLVWCAEQALTCPSKVVGLAVVFPEDLGGRKDGPTSIWMLRGFQLLEGIRDARRGSQGKISNAHWEYYPRPSIFEVGCHSVGHGWKHCTEAHFQLPVIAVAAIL